MTERKGLKQCDFFEKTINTQKRMLMLGIHLKYTKENIMDLGYRAEWKIYLNS